MQPDDSTPPPLPPIDGPFLPTTRDPNLEIADAMRRASTPSPTGPTVSSLFTTPNPFELIESHEWGSLIEGNLTMIPRLLERAWEGRGTYRYVSSGSVIPEGKEFNPKTEDFTAALVSGLGAQCAVRVRNNSSAETLLFLSPARDSITVVRSENGNVYWAIHHGINEALYVQWTEIVTKLCTDRKVVRERRTISTDVHVLTGTAMRGYGLSECGVETSRLIPDNYDPETVARLRAAGKALAHPEPPGRLLLLEGPPGTGKTRALRSMIRNFDDDVRVIIVPPHLMADLSGPNLIGALLRCGRAVLVIEDADYALLDREKRSEADLQGSTSALSAILNLSDGILGAHIDLRIVATTNQHVDNLDAAVVRPGRLLDRISFGGLNAEQAQRVVRRELRREINLGLLPPTVGEGLGACTLAEAYAYVREQKKALPRGKKKPPAGAAASEPVPEGVILTQPRTTGAR